MKRVIIVGSPRSNGRSAHLAEMLFEAHIDEQPEDELFLVPVSEVEIGPCIGCNACRGKIPVTFKDDAGGEVTEMRHRCVFDDDMQTLYDLIDEADELTVVSPIYFSGAPAPMKCVFDRLQPYFWVTQAKGRQMAGANAGDGNGQPDSLERRLAVKRPATLHVVGEGGDPHGFMPLVSEARSALACAGFKLEHVFDWVGKINRSGEIVADAEEAAILPMGAAPLDSAASDADAARSDTAENSEGAGSVKDPNREPDNADALSNPRPKLALGSGSDRAHNRKPDRPKPRGEGKKKASPSKRNAGGNRPGVQARKSKGKGRRNG